MLGLLLVIVGAFFLELSSSIGKYENQQHKEGMYTMGFLSNVCGILFFGIILLWNQDIGFSLASLPTFSIRAILEIVQIYISLKAATLASRSTYSFVHTGTVPILLCIDLFLVHANISEWQIIGMVIITASLAMLSLNRCIDRQGLWFVIASTVNGAITISLFKYNVTHFNTVAGEQFFIILILLVYLIISAKKFDQEIPWKFLKQPVFIAQSATYGIGLVLDSFAYLFGAASVITVIKRAASVLWSVVSGRVLFHEQHFVYKCISFACIALGIFLLAT